MALVSNSYQISFAEFQGSLRQLEDVIADAVFIRSVFDVDITLWNALDVDVAFLVHAHLGSFADLPFRFLGPIVAHRIVKAIQSDPMVTHESKK